jgi:hypothetical protein
LSGNSLPGFGVLTVENQSSTPSFRDLKSGYQETLT